MMQKQAPKLYLSYGANCNVDDMKVRAPASIPIGVYKLFNFKLAFNHVADIRQAPGDTCICGLWFITDDCESSLDIFEGYPTLYNKKYIKIEKSYIKPFEWISLDEKLKDNDNTALLYVMNGGGRYSRYSPPSKSYTNTIRKGYDFFNIPKTQLKNAEVESQTSLWD